MFTLITSIFSYYSYPFINSEKKRQKKNVRNAKSKLLPLAPKYRSWINRVEGIEKGNLKFGYWRKVIIFLGIAD